VFPQQPQGDQGVQQHGRGADVAGPVGGDLGRGEGAGSQRGEEVKFGGGQQDGGGLVAAAEGQQRRGRPGADRFRRVHGG
jgi:hypothetical protein